MFSGILVDVMLDMSMMMVLSCKLYKESDEAVSVDGGLK